MFRALVWKELREHWLWGLACMVVMGAGMFLIVLSDREYAVSGLLRDLVLMTPVFMAFTAIGFAASGLLLGVVIVVRESGGDMWTLLVHRPTSVHRIIAAKLVVAIGLYVMSGVLPLALLAWWLSVPGHYPMPLRGYAVLVSLVDMVCGLGYLGVGIVVVLSRGRWFGVRALTLFSAAAMSWLAVVWFHYALPAALACMAFSLVSLASGWSAFVTDGRLSTDIGWRRISWGMVCVVGVMGIASILIKPIAWLRPRDLSIETASYHVREHGEMMIHRRWGQDTGELVTMDGGVIAEGAEDVSMFLRERVQPITLVFDSPPFRDWAFTATYRRNNGLFIYLGRGFGIENWHFDTHTGLALCYSNINFELLGSIGANGYVPAAEGLAESVGHSIRYLPRDSTVLTERGAFRFDLEGRSLTWKYESPAGQAIDTARPTETRVGWWRELGRGVYLLSERRISVINESGELVWSCDLVDDEKYVSFQTVADDDGVGVMYQTLPELTGIEANLLVRYDWDGRELWRRELPIKELGEPGSNGLSYWFPWVATLPGPTPVWLWNPMDGYADRYRMIDWREGEQWWGSGLAVSLITVGLIWVRWLGRRRGLGRIEMWVWTGLAVVVGVWAGFVMLCATEKKRNGVGGRVERDGTEVFAPLI